MDNTSGDFTTIFEELARQSGFPWHFWDFYYIQQIQIHLEQEFPEHHLLYRHGPVPRKLAEDFVKRFMKTYALMQLHVIYETRELLQTVLEKLENHKVAAAKQLIYDVLDQNQSVSGPLTTFCFENKLGLHSKTPKKLDQ